MAMFLVSLRLHLISSDALNGEGILVAIGADQANINVFLISGMTNLNAHKYTTTATKVQETKCTPPFYCICLLNAAVSFPFSYLQ